MRRTRSGLKVKTHIKAGTLTNDHLADGLMGHVDAALEQEFLHVAVAQKETLVEPDPMADDLPGEAGVLIAFGVSRWRHVRLPRSVGCSSWPTAAGPSSSSMKTRRASVGWTTIKADAGMASSAPRAGHAGVQFSGVPALDARRPEGLSPLRGAPIVPGGPSPDTPAALPGCGVMAYRDQSTCSLPPYAQLTN